MDIKRIKLLAGVIAPVATKPSPTLVKEFHNIRMSDEIEFKRTAKQFGAVSVQIKEQNGFTVAVVTFDEATLSESEEKYKAFLSETKMTAAQKKERDEKSDKDVDDKDKDENEKEANECKVASEETEKVSEEGSEEVKESADEVVNEARIEFKHGEGIDDDVLFMHVNGELIGSIFSDGGTSYRGNIEFWDFIDVNQRGPNKNDINRLHSKDEAAAALLARHNHYKKEAANEKRMHTKNIKSIPAWSAASARTKDEVSKDERAFPDIKSAFAEYKKSAFAESVSESGNNNFMQTVDDSANELNARMGVDVERKATVKVPATVKASVAARIKELKQSIEQYDEKGYNDQSQKTNAIDALEQILDNLSSGDVEGFKKAQIFHSTLMSPITDLFPSNLMLFLADAKIDWLDKLK